MRLHSIVALIRRSIVPALALVAGIALMVPQRAWAQADITPSGTGRFYVELRDSSLADALEMIYKAIGNPPHIIDPSAQSVNIGFVTFPNAVGTELPRILATQYNYRVRRNETGAFVVEPRIPPPSTTFSPYGSQQFGSGSGSGAALPSNPFGAPFGAQPNYQARPDIVNFSDAQTAPAFGRRGGGGGGGGGDADSGKEFRLIPVEHVFVGGIAKVFGKYTEVTTMQFVDPTGGSGGGGAAGGAKPGGGFGGGGFGGGGATSIGGSSTGMSGSTGGMSSGGAGGVTGGLTAGGGGFGGGITGF